MVKNNVANKTCVSAGTASGELSSTVLPAPLNESGFLLYLLVLLAELNRSNCPSPSTVGGSSSSGLGGSSRTGLGNIRLHCVGGVGSLLSTAVGKIFLVAGGVSILSESISILLLIVRLF